MGAGGRQGRRLVVWSPGDLACWCGYSATRAVTMKASTQSCHQRGRAADAIFSSHERPVVSAPGRCPSRRGRPSPSARRAPRPAHDPVSGRDGDTRGMPEPDCDMEARRRPHRRRARNPEPGDRARPSVGVDHPQSPPGHEPGRPRLPPDVMVLYAHRHHRGQNGDRGGRQDYARVGPAPATTRHRNFLEALDQTEGIVVGQHRVADKSNQRSPRSGSFSNPWTSTGR